MKTIMKFHYCKIIYKKFGNENENCDLINISKLVDLKKMHIKFNSGTSFCQWAWRERQNSRKIILKQVFSRQTTRCFTETFIQYLRNLFNASRVSTHFIAFKLHFGRENMVLLN